MRYVNGVRGDDDALDEYLDRIDADETENDPDASDLGGEQRGGADETEPDTHEDAGAITMNAIPQSTAEHTDEIRTVLEDPNKWPDIEREGRTITPYARLERTTTVTHVTPNMGVSFTQAQAHEYAEHFITEGQLKPHSAVFVCPVMDLVRPTPLDQDDEAPMYLPQSRSVTREAEPVGMEQGRIRLERTTVMISSRPDWALDPNPDTWAAIILTGPGDEDRSTIEMDVDHPEELRAIAQFFNDAADDLEKTQTAVKAAQAEAGVTA